MADQRNAQTEAQLCRDLSRRMPPVHRAQLLRMAEEWVALAEAQPPETLNAKADLADMADNGAEKAQLSLLRARWRTSHDVA